MSTERNPLSDEVLRRVGRNLVIFQQIEGFLKALMGNFMVAGLPSNLAETHQKQKVLISKKTLGELVGKYTTEVLSDVEETAPEPVVPADWFASSLSISGTKEEIERLRGDLKMVTDERNDLVHHFLPRWQGNNEELLNETLDYLEAQRNKVLPLHKHLVTCLDNARREFELLAERLLSDLAQSSGLQNKPLIAFLGEVADKYPRHDGWTYLSQAGSLAARLMPEETKRMLQDYGCKTFKQLLAESGIFDVVDEPLAGTNFRTIYRRKSELSLVD